MNLHFPPFSKEDKKKQPLKKGNEPKLTPFFFKEDKKKKNRHKNMAEIKFMSVS